jgi:Protein of unknown function (DUF3592)
MAINQPTMTKEELKARLQSAKHQKQDFWGRNFTNIFIWVGMLLFGIGLAIAAYNYNFMQNATETEGIVIRLDGGSRRQGYAPVIEYSDDNHQMQTYYSMEFSRPPMYQVGEKVKIYFKTEEPANASMGMSWIPIMILGGMGAFFMGIGAIFKKAFNV